MKRLFSLLLCICMILTLAACGAADGTPSEEDLRHEYEVFRSLLNDEESRAVNARVITDANGDRMLMADIKNNGFFPISEITLSFAAWDANHNFVVIKSKNNPTNTASEFQMDIPDVTVEEKGGYWSADVGIFLAPDCPEIAHVEAIMISCTKNGNTAYENSYYEQWKKFYLDKPYADWMKTLDEQVSPEAELAALRKDLNEKDVFVTKTEILKDSKDGNIYLCANIKNNSGKSITAFTLGFVAWDSEGKPIILKSASGDTPDQYVKRGTLSDVTVAAGQEWIGCSDEQGNVIGLPVTPDLSHIDYIEAVVISYTTDDSQSHENSSYTRWELTFGAGSVLEDWMKLPAPEAETQSDLPETTPAQ